MAETREVVLAAARRLIADEGPDAVTPTRLTAMTGVSRSTIYRHWHDPRAIIFEATASDTTRPPFEPTGVPLDDLRSYLEALREALKSTQGALLATQIDRAEHDDEASDVMRRISAQRREMISQMLAEAPDRFGPLHALIVGPLIFQRYLDRDDIGDELIDMIVEAYAAMRDHRQG
ncbi:MAG: TetR/AcrR family transcriptional regulator [Chloroflexota bacterium]|nr:TetR/AcrR family transcriptional regulator [Chloroflexota bacterium]